MIGCGAVEVSGLLLGGVMGLQREWVTGEVEKGSGKRQGGWDWVRASPVNLSVSVWGLEGQHGVVGLSNPQRVRIWAAKTSRRSDPHYRVWGGCSEVVLFGLNKVVWGFELISSRSHDVVAF